VEQLLNSCVDLARRAGEAVMEIYASGDFEVQVKADDTPLTKADLTANQMIVDGLGQISDFPIISEEGAKDAEGSNTFWLVDPVDGTKDFINRTGDFTINIGLVKQRTPVLGVVYAPAKQAMYFGLVGTGAFKQTGEDDPVKIEAKFKGSVPVITTHSKLDDGLRDFLAALGEYDLLEAGSSLKICLVAEGVASANPRFYGSHLWDTAAAEAVLRAAGGTMKTPDGQPLVYDPQQTLQNPFFIAQTA
jgi:3'(2'), 5'-bisphosphate nucleotidase